MRNFFKNIGDTLSHANRWCEFLCLIATYLFLAWALQPLSPFITVIVALIATGFAISRGKLNTVIAVTGIVLYALCWPISASYGVWVGQAVWTTSILLWFSSVFWRFQLYPLAANW